MCSTWISPISLKVTPLFQIASLKCWSLPRPFFLSYLSYPAFLSLICQIQFARKSCWLHLQNILESAYFLLSLLLWNLSKLSPSSLHYCSSLLMFQPLPDYNIFSKQQSEGPFKMWLNYTLHFCWDYATAPCFIPSKILTPYNKLQGSMWFPFPPFIIWIVSLPISLLFSFVAVVLSSLPFLKYYRFCTAYFL